MINWSSFSPVGKEEEYLMEAFRSGWVSGGEYVGRFQSRMEQLYTGSSAYTVSNGTAALQLAIQALGGKIGQEVIVPAFCFQAGANVCAQLGLKPIFCDVDPLKWNQTLATVSRAYTENCVGVIVLHNYGVAAEVKNICDWAKSKNLWVIEDCAEAWFTRHKEKYVGQFGDIGTFSMHATKTIACGEGGVLITNRPELNSKVELLRSHGLDRKATQYFHLLPGNNYRLSNLHSAVALAQLEEYKSILAQQRSRSKMYKEQLKDHWAIDCQVADSGESDEIWAVGVYIKFDYLDLTRDELLVELKNAGIDARPGFYAAEQLPYFSASNMCVHSTAIDVAKSTVVLPTNSSLSEAEISFICETLMRLLEKNSKADRKYECISLRDSPERTELLTSFLSSLSEGRKRFRYFDSRSSEILSSHITTLAILVDEKFVAYGHLEEEAETVWLGVAIKDGETGKGLGNLMMRELLLTATKLGLNKIKLRVDSDNEAGLRLYEKFGFSAQKDASLPGSKLMERIL